MKEDSRNVAKRGRNKSSDTEEAKRPTKMADKETTLTDLRGLLVNMQKEQDLFKINLSKSITDLKLEFSRSIESRLDNIDKNFCEKIDVLERRMIGFEQRLQDLESKGCSTEGAQGREECTQQLYTDKPATDSAVVRSLQYKTLDLESKTRQNNVIIYNLPEVEGEDLGLVFRDFINNKLIKKFAKYNL